MILSRVVASALMVVIAAVSSGQDVPDVLTRFDSPIWVASDVAVDASGELRLSEFGSMADSVAAMALDARQTSRKPKYAATPTGTAALQPPELEGCTSFFGTAVQPMPGASLDDLATHARQVISGRVVSMRQGFWGGLPYSLIRLDAAYLRGHATRETYLLYPLARIHTNKGLICATPPPGEFTAPAIGDCFLIFSTDVLNLDGRTIVEVDVPSDIVHVPAAGGPPRLPKALRATFREQHFEAIVSAVSQRLPHAGPPPEMRRR